MRGDLKKVVDLQKNIFLLQKVGFNLSFVIDIDRLMVELSHGTKDK